MSHSDLQKAIVVFFYPARWLLVGILGWKLFPEFLYPISGAPIRETIERGAGNRARRLHAAEHDRRTPGPQEPRPVSVVC